MGNLFALLGGLGIFLFGLRVMSRGLQKLAGERLRSVLAGLTRNRATGILSGFLITCAVQSSSATTVLVVSFANAGLLVLVQAMGLVMGANIGTTLTAWVVSLLGFKIKISAFALPIIGIGFPLSLLSSPRAKQLSEVFVGFGLLFLGLSFLKDGVPDLKSSPEAFEFAQSLTGFGFGSILLFVFFGSVLSVVVQSSSAASAITLTMVAKGWIGLDLAAAMVLGENIGTTVTAQLASIGANRNARRVANFHTLFNVIGVLWMLPAMPLFLWLIRHIINGDPSADVLVATTQVALFHTLFNVTNTFVLFWFVHKLEKVVMWTVPRLDDEREAAHFTFLQTGLLDTAELVSVEVQRGVREMVAVCRDAFANVTEVINKPAEKLGNLVDEIWREEQKTDDMELEIINFCSEWARSGSSEAVGHEVARTLEMANDIERIGDHCTNLVLLAQRRFDKGYFFDDAAQAELAEMAAEVSKFLELTIEALDDPGVSRIGEAKIVEQKINKLRDESRKLEAERVGQPDYLFRRGLLYLDMMTNMEKIGDYCWNVVKLLERSHEASAASRK
jgi:phosphate:Na+ symporter